MPNGWMSRRVLLWAIVCVLVAGLAIAGCVIPPPKKVAFGCPEHEINVVLRDTLLDTVVTSIPLAPETATMPEFHDCQRMQIGSGYGPLIAIWAAQDLAAFFPNSRSRTQDDTVYAVAQIWDLGKGPHAVSGSDDYLPLSIKAGLNCVYLWRSPSAPDSFSARIVFMAKKLDLGRCLNTTTRDSFVLSGQPLSVHVIRYPKFPASAIPPVARWDQDPVSRVQYIGLRCGDAWCEIGPEAGFTSSQAAIDQPGIADSVQAAYEADPGFSIPADRWPVMQMVKGWYDQQELEVWKSDSVLVPSGVIGTIIPNPVLDVIGKTAGSIGPTFPHRWVPSAYIHVTGDYHGKKLQLKKGVSRMYLCKGAADDCPGVAGVPNLKPDADSMWSKLVGPDRETSYHSVAFNTHGGGVLPAGAARWRWLETDGTTWLRCANGCCTNR